MNKNNQIIEEEIQSKFKRIDDLKFEIGLLWNEVGKLYNEKTRLKKKRYLLLREKGATPKRKKIEQIINKKIEKIKEKIYMCNFLRMQKWNQIYTLETEY